MPSILHVVLHLRRAVAGFLLAAAAVAPAASAEIPKPLCRELSFEGARYVVCDIDLKLYRIETVLNDAKGMPYGAVSPLVKARATADEPVLVAMNAGMYDADLAPVGLYVESGKLLKKANTARGMGNFHMKPNGVFYGSGTSAGVLETEAYLKRAMTPDFATQSGPMLVIRGQLHPRFQADGASKHIRNGVGVRDEHRVVFAISREPVSFGAFARLFRDALKCSDALYLDGSVSTLRAPEIGLIGSSLIAIGPILAVSKRK